MNSSTKTETKSKRDKIYFQQRYRNRVFGKLVDWIAEECQREKVTKKELAERIGMDPAQLSRLLSHPSNLTIDTISELAFGLDGEADPPEITRFVDRRSPNYIHPLIARVVGNQRTLGNSVTMTGVGATTTTTSSYSTITTLKLFPEASAA